ncbi:MAG: arylsulfatase [Candidatus Latescibacterota bacterium]|jgi:arylsulfatase
MPNQPHVLLISTDHWPASLFASLGHPAIQTPTLDQLAKNGIRFTNAYSECPVCIPARRTLMTGTTPRTHGDRTFKETLPMPNVPTLAQTFRDNGYQAYAVGKLHVYPQRDRIGFDDVILAEEGRTQFDAVDDYELFLGEQGYPGQMFGHGMSNNDYLNRPWHLPEHCHVTNWATQNMARTIQRRDPTKPGFWFLSYCHPHPPLAPLQCYLDMYRDIDPPLPYCGDWAKSTDELPFALKQRALEWDGFTEYQIKSALRAFYAMCTHIDHQLRIVIGTLREERLLDDTIILFTSDHGDMLGNHGQWAKRIFYEDSANVPMILVGAANDDRVGHHRTDNRLVGWADVMPTLLDLAGIDIPDSVEGMSMVGDQQRDTFYGECSEGTNATRMIHDNRFKLIYYPVGNHTQLFDLQTDPRELNNLSASTDHANIKQQLTDQLISELYGGDENWVQDGQLVGLPDQDYEPTPNRGLSGQRGSHWPVPPQTGQAGPPIQHT